jgi:predicted PurR-regulated permease PerM
MPKNIGDTIIHISSGTIIRSILFVLLVAFLFFLRDLVLIVLTAVVIASAIEPALKWLVRFHIPRPLAALFVFLSLAVFISGVVYFFIPLFLAEMSVFLSTLPDYVSTFSSTNLLNGTGLLGGGEISSIFSLQEIIYNLQSALTNVSEGFLRTVSVVFGGAVSFALILVFSFYFSVQESGIDDFLRVITPVKHQKYVIGLWKRSQLKIGRWMQGQLLLGLLIGVLVYLGLTVLGVKYALLLALIAALFELIPVFGATLAAIPAVAVAFVDGGLTLALLVVGLYVIIQQFENHLIYPLVVTKVVGVPPLLVILALLIGAKVAGFLGIILSVPVAAAIQELVSDIQKERSAFQKQEESHT